MDAVSFYMEINGKTRKVTFDNFDLEELLFLDDELIGQMTPTFNGWTVNSLEIVLCANDIMEEVNRLDAKYNLDLSNLIEFVAWTKLEVGNALVIGLEKNISFDGFRELLTVHIEAIGYEHKGPIKLSKADKEVDYNKL